MTIIVIGISFTVIWLLTAFLIVRYVKTVKNDLLKKFSVTEKLPEEKSENEDFRQVKPFDYVKRVEPENLIYFIQQEQPQIIALVLAHLEPDKASVILQALPLDVQSDVSRRIATLDHVNPKIAREIERVLAKKLCSLSSEDYVAAGGIENAAEILNHIAPDSKAQIIKKLEDEDPELAEMIRDGLKTMRKPCRKIWKILGRKSKSAVSVNE